MYKNGHLSPWGCSFAKEEKSRCMPGRKPKSDQEYFEILSLCILQAGLNWGMVRKNWPKTRTGFFDFDINKLSKERTNGILKRPGVYKNRRKVRAVIENAKEFQMIKRDFGDFSNFLKSLKKSKGREAVKLLAKQFGHVGEYTSEYYLHSVGYFD